LSRLVLLHYGDHPVIEPGELYLRVVLQDGAARPSWMEEYGNRLEDFRAQTAARRSWASWSPPTLQTRRPPPHRGHEAGRHLPARYRRDELARGFVRCGSSRTRGPGHAGHADHRGYRGQPGGGRALALARVREQPSSAGEQPSARASSRPARASPRRGQTRTGRARSADQQAPGAGEGALPPRRGAAARCSSTATIRCSEPGDRLVRVWIEEAEEDRPCQPGSETTRR